MAKHLCIHCHFYQPPREDPWMETVFPEGSAAPFLNWNERICRECYSPLGWAGRQDGQGKIFEMFNCYEWMSFNAGPTLMSWMESGAPKAYARILEGDVLGMKRLGHGNAIAQVQHHAILPLATRADKEAEVAWGVADFEARFGRRPEGMWLAEAAVDTESLEVLAENGIAFVILAPRQIKAVGGSDGGEPVPVAEADLDTSEAYRVDLPSGRSIAAFPYHGPLSQAVAFEGLLSDGEAFWRRLAGGAREGGLLSLATDGETYGHHFTFGEMALAHVLSQAREERDGVRIDNYGSWLEHHPPTRRAVIHENSSWSCVHGVGRWHEDCGCSSGGHPGWNQKWRGPLRQGLNRVRDLVDAHFRALAPPLFRSPADAILNYGQVLAGLVSMDEFMAAQAVPGLSQDETENGWKLLAMKKWSLASFASCAWFFDDIGRIEPLNAMTCALKAMDIARETGAPDMEKEFTDIIATARSNEPELGTGLDLWRNMILPRRESPASATLQAVLTRLDARGGADSSCDGTVAWPGLEIDVSFEPDGALAGTACVRSPRDRSCRNATWEWKKDKGAELLSGTLALSFPLDPDAGPELLEVGPETLPWGKLQAIAVKRVERADEELWEAMSRQIVAASLFLPFQEAQTCQTDAPIWESLWPAMAWNAIFGAGPVLAGDSLKFLREHAATHSARAVLALRVAERLERMLSMAGQDWDAVESALSAVERIGLGIDLWPVQRAFWNLGPSAPDRSELRRLLGFAANIVRHECP